MGLHRHVASQHCGDRSGCPKSFRWEFTEYHEIDNWQAVTFQIDDYHYRKSCPAVVRGPGGVSPATCTTKKAEVPGKLILYYHDEIENYCYVKEYGRCVYTT